MRGVLWMALFSTCLLGVTVDSVIIREYRAKAKLELGSDAVEDLANSRAQHGGRKRRKTFRPNIRRCCKIGYKVAKRKLSCDISLLEVVRKVNDMQRAKMKYNRPHKKMPMKISAKLSRKLGECSKSFPKFLKKCCSVRTNYYKTMARCKKRPRKQRRTCRKETRKLYEMDKKGRHSSNRKQRRSKGRRGA